MKKRFQGKVRPNKGVILGDFVQINAHAIEFYGTLDTSFST